MTFQKFAEATIIGAEIARRDAFGLVKAAHRAVFDYEPKPGFLYVRSRMISICFFLYRFCASFPQARQWREPLYSYVFFGVNSCP